MLIQKWLKERFGHPLPNDQNFANSGPSRHSPRHLVSEEEEAEEQEEEEEEAHEEETDDDDHR